jgi:hypothetical protein
MAGVEPDSLKLDDGKFGVEDPVARVVQGHVDKGHDRVFVARVDAGIKMTKMVTVLFRSKINEFMPG